MTSISQKNLCDPNCSCISPSRIFFLVNWKIPCAAPQPCWEVEQGRQDQAQEGRALSRGRGERGGGRCARRWPRRRRWATVSRPSRPLARTSPRPSINLHFRRHFCPWLDRNCFQKDYNPPSCTVTEKCLLWRKHNAILTIVGQVGIRKLQAWPKVLDVSGQTEGRGPYHKSHLLHLCLPQALCIRGLDTAPLESNTWITRNKPLQRQFIRVDF